MNSAGGKKSPHKVCMLLTMMDLIQAGHLVKNRIEFNQAVKDRFSHYFDSFAQGNDHNTPDNPFYHLKREGFWHLSYHAGYAEANTKRYSAKAIEYAYLD